jgi:hypothetical protein
LFHLSSWLTIRCWSCVLHTSGTRGHPQRRLPRTSSSVSPQPALDVSSLILQCHRSRQLFPGAHIYHRARHNHPDRKRIPHCPYPNPNGCSIYSSPDHVIEEERPESTPTLAFQTFAGRTLVSLVASVRALAYPGGARDVGRRSVSSLPHVQSNGCLAR